MCKQLYHTTIHQLSHKENKTKEEIKFLKNYYKYMPVIKNNCTMNLLAYHIENIENKYKWNKKEDNDITFNYKLLLSQYFVPNEKILSLFRKEIGAAFRMFTIQVKTIKENSDEFYNQDVLDSLEQNLYQNIKDLLKEKLFTITSNEKDVANYTVYCYYNFFTTKSKSWMWDICGNAILQNLKEKASVAFVPKECGDGTEYLGKHYILEQISLID